MAPSERYRIDADGKLTWRAGVAAVAFGAQAGTALAALAATDRGFLEWVLRKDCSDAVKAIVREALAGRFPVRRETGRAPDAASPSPSGHGRAGRPRMVRENGRGE